MKIIGTQGPHVTETSKQTAGSKSRKGDFKKIMEQAMNELRPNTAQAPDVMGTSMLGGLKPVGPTDSGPAKAAVIQVESMLNKLDYYANKLADHSIQISDLSPLMDDMESDIVVLEKMRSGSEIPPGLDKIVSDLVATITAEIEKFRRGDYS